MAESAIECPKHKKAVMCHRENTPTRQVRSATVLLALSPVLMTQLYTFHEVNIYIQNKVVCWSVGKDQRLTGT